MSTDSYSQYKIYENPDYFADKEEAEEKWEEWWLDWIRGIMEEQNRIDEESKS